MRHVKNMKGKSAASMELDDADHVPLVHTGIADILLRELEDRNDRRNHMASKGRHTQSVELLSSDSGSDDPIRPRVKHSVRRRGSQQHAKGRGTISQARVSQGRLRRTETRSPSMSPESSHAMDYSYEEDTLSIGGASPNGETKFSKLKWPSDSGASLEGEVTGKKNANHDVHCNTGYLNKHSRKKADVDISSKDVDESEGEDTGRNAIGTESEGEEMPVLPRVPVKRKVASQPRVCERRTQRGRTQSGKSSDKETENTAD